MRVIRETGKVVSAIPAAKIDVKAAIGLATTSGLWLMVNKVLENTQNKKVRAEDLLYTPEGKKLKDDLNELLTTLFNKANIT